MIKTLNTNEELPNYFYIFTNRNEDVFWNQCENHNINIRNGLLVSAGFYNAICPDKKQRERFLDGELIYAPFVPNYTTTLGKSSPFTFRLIQRYNLEYALELTRYNHFKTYPSRFSCIYAFGSLEECIIFSKGKKNWDIGGLKKFRLLSDDENKEYIKVVRANFKFIGLMESYPMMMLSSKGQELLCRHYWEGKGKLVLPEIKIAEDVLSEERKCDNLNEYLIEGVLEEVEFTEGEKKRIDSIK